MRAFIAVLLCSLFLISTSAFAQDAKFHTPQTDAEKALENLVSINNRSSDLEGFLLQSKWYKKRGEQKYLPLFTKDFMDSVVSANKMLDKKCAHNSVGCNIDYSPVTCEQFGAKKYVYKTLEQTEKYAIVTYNAVGEIAESPMFRLINDNGSWKLDGVKCSKDEDFDRNFNFTKN